MTPPDRDSATRSTTWSGRTADRTKRLLRTHRRVLVGWVIVAITGVIVASQLFPGHTPVRVPEGQSQHSIVVGVSGLRWADVNPSTTPTLWRLAETGAVGSLVAESESLPTCPLDGWLTLSAGARADGGTALRENGACPALPSTDVEVDESGGAAIESVVVTADRNREEYQGVEIGALAESVRCSVAIGPGAAFGAVRPTGRVDQYIPALPAESDDVGPLLRRCALTLIDLGTLSENPTTRSRQLSELDDQLARVNEARPEDSTITVAGLAETSATQHLHAVMVNGEGFTGWLTSAGSGREGYLRLIDLAPTAVSVLDRPLPTPFAGSPAGVVEERDAPIAKVVAELTDSDIEAAAQQDAVNVFLLALTVAILALFVFAATVLHRIRRGAGPIGRRPPTIWTFRVLVSVACALSLTLPAATLVDVVPWWRADHTMIALLVSTVVIVVALTALALLAPRRRSPMGLMITVSLVGLLVVGVDILTGGGLQFGGVTAYTTSNSAGNATLGPLGFGVFATSLLMASGCAAQGLPRPYRPIAIALAGSVGVLLVGSPYLGDDPSGAIALTVGICLAAGISTGGWLTFGRFAWSAFAGLGLLLVLAIADVTRPESERGALGGFLADMFSGNGMGRIRAIMESDVVAVGNALTVLLIGSIVFGWSVLLPPSGGLKRSFGLYPSARAGFVGAIVATLLGGLLGGSGFVPVGAAASITMPLAIIMALRVLARAHVRDGRSMPADLDIPVRPDVIAADQGVTVESRG
ncbi:hypothetical protein [Stackebrandtia soli]|uniref:hypothetical protein n=1 Tax=Stackebrandtia soli TaxID=1892856 RepID=UPI0039EC11FD